jgi:hypothetical protein
MAIADMEKNILSSIQFVLCISFVFLLTWQLCSLCHVATSPRRRRLVGIGLSVANVSGVGDMSSHGCEHVEVVGVGGDAWRILEVVLVVGRTAWT